MMKVKSSNYLKQIKSLLRTLLDRLLQEYSYVSILASDSVSKQYGVSKQGIYAGESGLLAGRGFVIKVYDGSSYSEFSYNDITEEKIEEIIEDIRHLLSSSSNVLPEGLELSNYKPLPDEPLTFCESTEYEIDPEQLGDETIINRLVALSKQGKEANEKILDCNVFCNYQKYSKLFCF